MKKPVYGTLVELEGGPGHVDEGCMAVWKNYKCEMEGTHVVQRNSAYNTGLSSYAPRRIHNSCSRTSHWSDQPQGQRTAYKIPELVHNFLVKKTSKKSPEGKRTCLLPGFVMLHIAMSLEQNWKNGCWRSFQTMRDVEKSESQKRRAVVQHRFDRQVKQGKTADCFTLLKRITN